MQLKLFVAPVQDFAGTEAEMNAFLRSRRVLSVRKEFVADGSDSFWAFCVEHLDQDLAGVSSGVRPPRVDYREVLEPQEFEVFSRLRDWRKKTAEQEGVPVYSVMTNEQLAQAVQRKVSTRAGLKEIEGVGEARIKKYGEAVLEALTTTPPV